MTDPTSLRERKLQRTRQAIVDAAMDLFDQRGFDDVTVADIARSAEVGRSTFFRYFKDKQEVLFSDTAELELTLVAAATAMAATLEPLGDSLADAFLVARAGMLALARHLAPQIDHLPLRVRLIENHGELTARHLSKQQNQVLAIIGVLTGAGASTGVSVMAARLASACYETAKAQAAASGQDFTSALEDAFRRLCTLDGPELLHRFDSP